MELASLFDAQLSRYPAAQMADLLKALYQSVMGCGHFAPEESRARARLLGELHALSPAAADAPLFEELGSFSRAHLAPCQRALVQPETLLRLFLLSAGAETPERRKALAAAVAQIPALALPFDAEAVRRQTQAYLVCGCPPLHHSEAFRAAYAPAYRVVRTELARLLPLLARVDALMARSSRAVVAIDGCCASGKTTLAALLGEIYGADVLHMDDFFLRPGQRTPERYAAPGENVDHERFFEEVLLPLSQGRPYLYRRYDCQSGTLLPGQTRAPGRLTIVEGSYSLHPSLSPRYGLRILLTLDGQAQSARILARNGAAMHERFCSLWIPLENRYFEQTGVLRRCDLALRVRPDAEGNNRYEVIKE
ncbi:MAG: hypothetical protein MSL26_05815 [Clostridiales bacterium]|nr:hypothetical protein [Clostridiales bacterium]